MIRRAIGHLKEAEFVSLVGKAVEEPPADHLLVVRLAYSPEMSTRFEDPSIGVAFKHLLLCLAAASGRCDVIEVLLNKGASLADTVMLDCANRWRTRMSPLHYSVRFGHRCATQILINSGADVNCRWHLDQGTPLCEAGDQLCRKGVSDIIPLLLEEGASPNIGAPLVELATYASAEMIEFMVSHGAHVNQESPGDASESPLLRAIRFSNVEATRQLLQGGANVHRFDTFSNESLLGTAVSIPTDFGYCRRCRTGRYSALTRANSAIIMLLLDHGANIDFGSPAKSPLALAAASANFPAIEILISRAAEWKDTTMTSPISLQNLKNSYGRLSAKPKGLLILKRITKCHTPVTPLDFLLPMLSEVRDTLDNIFHELKGRPDECKCLPPTRYSTELQSNESEFWNRLHNHYYSIEFL